MKSTIIIFHTTYQVFSFGRTFLHILDDSRKMVKRSHFSNRFEPTYDIFNIISNYARHSTSLFKLRYIVRNKQANLLILLHVLFDLNCLYCCLFSHLKFLVYLNVIKFYLIFTICRSFIVFVSNCIRMCITMDDIIWTIRHHSYTFGAAVESISVRSYVPYHNAWWYRWTMILSDYDMSRC